MEADLILDTINGILDENHLNRLRGPVARTHGGEWVGPCPKCKMDTGNGGKDRLQVWPMRPVEGNGSHGEPCYACRVCKSLSDGSRPWSGDLPSFLQDTQHISWHQARGILGLGDVSNDTTVLFKPSSAVTGAPSEQWQKQASALIEEAEECLWSDEGKRQRKYLLKRKLTEETIRAAHLGAIPEERFMDGEKWGASSGRIHIARGVLIPEYHALEVDGIVQRDVWSLAVRRDPDDLLMEKIEMEERGEDGSPDKYKFVAGSKKGLYGFNTLQVGLPAVMVEGQIDQLTAWQEMHGEIGVVAIQSVTGGRADLWRERINEVAFWLISTDPDVSGMGAYKYWSNLILPNKRFAWVPSTDFNSMLVQGQSVADFLQLGINEFTLNLQQASSLRASAEVTLVRDLVDTPLFAQETLTVIVEGSVVTVTMEDVPDVCSVCGAEVEYYSSDGVPYCDACMQHVREVAVVDALVEGKANGLDVPLGSLREPTVVFDEESGTDMIEMPLGYRIALSDDNRCTRCGKLPMYHEGTYAFCESDFASAQLLREGALMGYPSFAYTPGKGLVDAVKERWERTDKGGLLAGEENYIDFIRAHSPASIWKAMHTLHRRRLDAQEKQRVQRKVVVVPAERPCARQPGGCTRDYRVPVQTNRTQVKAEGEQWAKSNAPYVYPPDYGMTTMTSNGDRLHWCANCIAGYNLLAFGEFLGYPAFSHVLEECVIGEGEDAWIHFATHSEEYNLTFTFGEVTRLYAEKWKKAQSFIVVEE